MLDDKFNDLEDIFKKEVEEIKIASHDDLIILCKNNEIDFENKDDEELRKILIDIYNKDIS